MATAFELAESVRNGAASAESLVAEALARVEAVDGELGAFLRLDRDAALETARAVDQAVRRGEDPGPLAGVPIAVKDNICTRNGPTTAGSRLLENFHSLYDADVVERLQRAGAILIGKTNLDEFAMGSSTESSAFRLTRNPWNGERVPGGSSGGSAAAVAARLVPAALGSSTGGSIRQPAAFCGVTGLKPSYGRVSRYGLIAYASSLDHVGSLTTDARDAALLLGVMAGHDARDSTSVERPTPDYLAGLNRPLAGLRVGVPAEYFGPGLDGEVRTAVEAAIHVLKGHGARVIDVELPHTPYAIACYYIIAPAEASSNLARFDGMRYGRRAAQSYDLLDAYRRSRGEGLGPEVKRRIIIGTYVLSAGYYDAYYLKALKVRTLIRRDFERAFQQVDVLAAPVAPTTAFRFAEKTRDPLAMYLEDVYTLSANLAGVCAISLPCGFDGGGLPIGFQLMGRAFDEETLLAAAHQYQLATRHHLRVPPAAAWSEP